MSDPQTAPVPNALVAGVKNMVARQRWRRRSWSAAKSLSSFPAQFEEALDLPVYEGSPRAYVIASTPRSGSHMLGHALAEAGIFGVPMEYLHPAHLRHWCARFQTTDITEVVRHLVRHRTGATGLFGLKAHWAGQFTPSLGAPLWGVLGKPEAFIWIQRRDLLKQAISYAIAEQTNVWITGATPVRAPAYDYSRTLRKAEDLAAQNWAWSRYLARQSRVHRVVYEDILADPDTHFTTLAAFLEPGTDAVPVLAKRTKRQSTTINKAWYARFVEECKPEHRWVLHPQDWSR